MRPSEAAQVRLCRHVISVDPSSGLALTDLGARLDERESAARERLRAQHGVDLTRTGEPRPGYANSDPWYDGRGHEYTIVDSPRAGSVLTVDEVREVMSELFRRP
jgi:hypothetical protein